MAKTKKGELVVGFVLDESGSMHACRDSTISGFNEYVDGLREQKGKTTLSLTMFSSDRLVSVPSSIPVHQSVTVADRYRPLCEAAPIGAVPRLSVENYRPDGNTPLYDAVGYTIRRLEAALADREYDGPVLFVIQTDGVENASREFNQAAIKALIGAKEKEGWRFVYLGANMDERAARHAGTFMGMSVGSTLSYDYAQTDSAFAGVTAASSVLRSNASTSSAKLASTVRDTRDEKEKEKDGGSR